MPDTVISHDFGKEFTISTWMRHEARMELKHRKEQILCLADDHRKSRHHTSLFIRNCKLVLLLRRGYEETERNVFKPAEWRWTLPQVCDDRWHHYAISVSAGGAELWLDGEQWQAETDNPEIIDDWPLHPAADIQTTLSVGACWHGSDRKMRHRLTGYLAGLAVLAGRREHSEVLRCLVQCTESLQLPATNLLEPGMEMVTNSHGSQVTIDGDNVDNMNKLVRQVAYLNTREFPDPGRRRLEMETKIRCQDGSSRKMSLAVSAIQVVSVPQPRITITGADSMSREYAAFREGVSVLAGLRVTAQQSGPNLLDSCTVSVFPPLNPDHESLQLAGLGEFQLVGSNSNTGLQLAGPDSVANYQQALKQVIYTNKKPAYYLNRQFKIVCFKENRKFGSNEYVSTVNISFS